MIKKTITAIFPWMCLMAGGTRTCLAQPQWRELLPVFGGSVTAIAVDARGTPYVSTYGGLFKSTDGGQTWVSALGDLPAAPGGPLATDPSKPGTVYAWTDFGLYRTANAGNTWIPLLSLPAGVYVNAIAVAPTDPNFLAVSTQGAYIYTSSNGGATWTQRTQGLCCGPGGPSYTTAIAIDPSNAKHLITTTWRGKLFHSQDAGATWVPINDSAIWASGQIYFAPSDPRVLYTLNDEYWFGRGTVLKSTDGGYTWSNAGRPDGIASDASQLVIDPTDANTVFSGTSQGLFETTSGGDPWHLVFAPTGQKYIASVAIDSSNRSLVYTGSQVSGLYISFDGASTWTPRNSGLAGVPIQALDLTRDHPENVIMGASGVGFFRSTDSGNSWAEVGKGQNFGAQGFGGAAAHPQDAELFLVAAYDVGTATSAIWRTVDGGQTLYRTTDYGVGNLNFNLIDPTKVNADLPDFKGGFLLSQDTGITWSVPQFNYIYPEGKYAYHPSFSNVVFTVADQYTGAPIDTVHIAWSNNGGLSWNLLPFGLGNFNDMAIDTSDPTTIYVVGYIKSEGTAGVYKFKVAYTGTQVSSVTRIPGVFNGGLTNTALRHIVYDTANQALLVSCSTGVFRSQDKAATWESLTAGLPYPSTDWLRITPDGSKLFVATSGGIWEYSSITQPSFLLSPNTLLFTSTSGGPISAPQQLSATSSAALTFSVSIAPSASWLKTDITTGSMPATIQVTADPSTLQPGSYQGTITITAPAALPPSRTLTVQLTVTLAQPPKLQVSPQSVSLSAVQGAPAESAQVSVSNIGGGALAFMTSTTTATGGAWLRVAGASNSLSGGAISVLTLLADPSALTQGIYSGSLKIVPATGNSFTIPVTFAVSAAQQKIVLSQTGLTFTAVSKGGSVLPQTIGILNSGQGKMDWSIKTTTLSGGLWLNVSTSSGSVARPYVDVSFVDVSVNAQFVPPGDYYGSIQVSATGAGNSPQTILVALEVLAEGSTPPPEVRPTGLLFVSVGGPSRPPSQSIAVSNPTASPLTLGSSRTYVGQGNWFSHTPTDWTISPDQPLTITVQPDFSGLSAGIRRGALTLAFSDGTIRTISILSVIAPSGNGTSGTNTASLLNGSRIDRMPGSKRSGDSIPRDSSNPTCVPAKLIPLFTSLGTNFNVPAAWPVPIETRVVDDCGSPMTSGAVVVSFTNNDPLVTMVPLGDGRWTGTWQPLNSALPQVTVTVSAQVPERQITGFAQITGGLSGHGDSPFLNQGGIVNSASLRAAAPLAPGAMVSLFGSRLSEGTAQAAGTPLGTELAGTVVTVGGKLMPLLYASDGQVNGIVPYGLSVNTRHQIVVQRGVSVTVPAPVVVAQAQPAIFTKDQSGKGQGVIVDLQNRYVEPGNPAQAGDALVIYCSGLGALDEPVADGTAAPAKPPAQVKAEVKVTIGGIPATVLFAGLTPGQAGLYQVNTVVPDGIAPGDAVLVVLTVAGQDSPPVSIAVK